MTPQKPWFIINDPKDEALKPYAGKRCELNNLTSNTLGLCNVFNVRVAGKLVWLKDFKNTGDFTQELPAPLQLELVPTAPQSGHATVKPVFVCIDAGDEMVDAVLSESEANKVLTHSTAVRFEQHWCIELHGKHYGLTGIEPLELGVVLAVCGATAA